MSHVTAGAHHVLLSSVHVHGAGGVQVVLRNLVKGLEATGRRVSFIHATPLPGLSLVETTNALGCRAFGCAMPVGTDRGTFVGLAAFLAYAPIAFFHLARLIRRERIDVINCHYVDLYFIHLVIAARLLRIPVIVSVHGADIDRYEESGAVQRWFFRQIMHGATRVVACSRALARQTSELFPEIGDKVTWVHNGIDVASRRVPVAAPQALPPRFVLCVCRQVRKKGVDVLLHAYARVAQVSRLPLVLVGDGPLMDEHKALARTLGLEQQVLFAGHVAHDDITPFFDACTLFVLPSRVEPFGLVILEAALSGKPIVATRVGGIPEILRDGVDGVLVEADAADALATEMIRLLEQPARAAQLGERARQTVLTRFAWPDRVNEYIDLFTMPFDGAQPAAVATLPRNDFGRARRSR